jgi:hypothetical protein
MLIDNKLGIKVRETAVVYLMVLSIHFNGGIEEHHKTLSYDRRVGRRAEK